jgi:large subunit ribosomal protein L23
VLTLLRTPNSPPNFATFLVPLNLNKLDMRDYLFHAYGIRVHGVRSYIQMSKLTQDKPGSKRPKPRKWFRPKSIKKMMVEMERPFVWPEEPKEFDMYVLMFVGSTGERGLIGVQVG